MGITSYFQDKSKYNLLLLAFLWMAMLAVAILLREVLLPFILAALLAYVLYPAVTWISHLRLKGDSRVPRWASVLIVYLVIGTVVYFFATIFLPQLYQELLRLANVASDTINSLNEGKIQELASRIDSFFQEHNIPVQIAAEAQRAEKEAPLLSIDLLQIIRGMIDEVFDYLRAQSIDIVGEVQYLLRQVFNFIFKFFLVLMIAGFILADTDRIKRFIFKMVPAKNWQAFEQFLAQIDRGLSGVVRGQLTICLVNAAFTLIGLLILQIKFALLLATLAGIFSLIPIFGSIISTIPITLVALTKSPVAAVLALAWIVGIHALEANFLNPKIMGNAAKIHPVLVILALIAGEHFYGLVGALLAVPIASILLNIFHGLVQKAQNKDVPISAAPYE